MSERDNQPTTFNRLRKSNKAKVAALAAGLALVAGCSAAKATGGNSGSGKAKPAATSTRTPGAVKTSPAATAPSSAPSGGEAAQASRNNWCSAASSIIEQAFVDPNTANECEVMPVSATPGDVLIRWTLNAAGVQGFSVDASVLNAPFKQFTSAAKPTQGGGTEYVIIPNSSQMYVEIPGNPNETGELEVLTGYGGAMPLGLSVSLAESAGVFAVFGSTPNSTLYPASAAQ